MIYFVRHGQTDYNVAGIMQGHLDIPLNQNGILQAQKVRDELKDFNIDIIYTSPLSRAKTTAKIINEFHDVKIVLDDRLKELFSGSAQGEVISSWPEEKHKQVFSHPEDFGGESIEAFCKRVSDFFDEIKNSPQNILIVSHAGVYRAIYKHINGFENFDFEIETPKNATAIKIKD